MKKLKKNLKNCVPTNKSGHFFPIFICFLRATIESESEKIRHYFYRAGRDGKKRKKWRTGTSGERESSIFGLPARRCLFFRRFSDMWRRKIALAVQRYGFHSLVSGFFLVFSHGHRAASMGQCQ